MIRHLVSPDILREIIQFSPGYVYPAYEAGWDDKFLTENTYARRVTDAWRAASLHPSGFTEGSWPGPPTAWTASLESSNFWTDMFGEVLSGKSVSDSVRDAHARAVRVFKEFGARGE